MRIIMLVIPLALAGSLMGGPLPAGKKTLTHNVYDGWNKVSGECISNDGTWVVYVIDPQEGDNRLVVANITTGRADTIARGDGPRISEDSRFAAFAINPFFADIRKAKIAKKKADDLPKDSLGIVELGTGSIVRIPRVKSFTMPEKGAGWIAYLLEKDPATIDSAKTAGRIDGAPDAVGDAKEKSPERGTTLIARELATGAEFRFPFISEYLFSKNGKSLLMVSTGRDSLAVAGVFHFSTSSRHLDTVSIGRGKFTGLAWDEDGRQAAYLADRDTARATQRFYALYYWKMGSDSGTAVADTSLPGLPRRWLISEHRTPSFSKDGRRLFFGTAPIPMPEDTTMNDEITAKLDVWNWQDDFLQTQQLKDLEGEQKRSYLASIDLGTHTYTQLGSLRIPVVTVGNEGTADVALGLSDVPYRKMESWEEVAFHDVYLIDMNTGSASMVIEKLKGGASLSPEARFMFWYDLGRHNWFAMDARKLTRVEVSKDIRVPLYNELNDLPDDPPPHGALGWTAGDSTLLLYDRFDIWSADPTGGRPAMNLTAGYGRTHRRSFRYVRTDPEERFLRSDATLLLRTFDRTTKSAGFSHLALQRPGPPHLLIIDARDFGTPLKAKNDTTYILTRSRFDECPDLYVTGESWGALRRISNVNPQQNEYLWGSVELFSWKTADNTPLEGLLYKPENFDPKKQYPMLVYYYERNSDYLHRYTPPQPSRSIINPAYCTSNGYIVFIPDIRYRVGHPGRSAYECIMPGVKKLIAAGFVDAAHIGLQGQSWGGYQTAYLVTQTSMFAAAMAGAPVANMTSAYGGISWAPGLSRMPLYEKSQSRIGGTLWEKRALFIENSPIFSADRVTTPLLVMANDNDGQVPWTQGIELFVALRRLGKQVWMLTYNGEAHNLLQRKNSKDLSVRMMQFFDHFLKGAPAPVWMTEGIPAIKKGKTLGVEFQ